MTSSDGHRAGTTQLQYCWPLNSQQVGTGAPQTDSCVNFGGVGALMRPGQVCCSNLEFHSRWVAVEKSCAPPRTTLLQAR